MTKTRDLTQNPNPTRANITLLNDDAILLYKLRELLQQKKSVKLSFSDVVHVALNKLHEIETTI